MTGRITASMVHIRRFFVLLVVGSLTIAACTRGGGSALRPSIPTCFSPRELLPFAFSPDGSQLAVRGVQGVQFFHIGTGSKVLDLTAPGSVLSAALAPDGETVAWSLDDNSIQLVQISDGSIRHTLIAHPDPVLDLRFLPTGSSLFSASHDGTVKAWDTDTGLALPQIEVGLEVLGIAVSPDGETLAVVPAYGPVQLWDIASGQQIATLGGTGGYDTSDPAFSPDGQSLAVDLATGIFIWKLPNGQEVWSAVANSIAVAYSPNGKLFAYADIDEGNKIFLGPADTLANFQVLDQMQGPVWELLFSPDSSLLAAADGIEIRVWRVSDGDLVAVGRSSCQ